MSPSLLIGVGLAFGVCLFATAVGFDRDRAFYPTVLIVVGSYYDLFAVMGGSEALVRESIGLTAFAVMAVVGFKRSLWIVAAGLVAHGVFDLGHAHLIANAGVPAWWPGFCMSYDVVAGAYLAWRLQRGKITA